MRRAIAALSLCLAGPALATETPVPTCEAPVAVVLEYIAAQPGYLNHHVLTASQRELPGAVFNMHPPVTDIDWTLIILVDHADGSGAIVVGMGDKICSAIKLPAERYGALVRSALGFPA